MVLTVLNARPEPPSNFRMGQQDFPSPVALETTPVPSIMPVLDRPAPEVAVTTLTGETRRLSDFSGQVVILSFWATWCPPCLEEMPMLQSYAVAHPDVPIIAITDSYDGQTLADIQNFIAEHQLNDLIFGVDASRRLINAFRVVNLPMNFVIDRDGVVRFRQIGAVTKEDLDYYLSALEG